MSIFTVIPGPVRRAVRAVLPARFVDAVKDAIMRRFYVRGFVSRTDPVVFAVRRHVLHQPPRLHRLLFHVTDHCNLNCKGCTHFSNVSPRRFADAQAYRRDMERLTRVFSAITEIFLLGGEPLLHPDLATFVTTTRELWPSSRIVVMTNGVLVPRMAEEVWRAMHTTGAVLHVDDYPVGPTREEIGAAAAAHGVTVEWTEAREEFFRLPIDLKGGQDAADSFRKCRGVMNCPVLRDGRLYPCAYIAFIDIFQQRFGVEGIEPTPADSISIDEAPYTVMDFLMQPVPWCAHCDFGHMETYEWGRSERTIDEWVRTPPA